MFMKCLRVVYGIFKILCFCYVSNKTRTFIGYKNACTTWCSIWIYTLVYTLLLLTLELLDYFFNNFWHENGKELNYLLKNKEMIKIHSFTITLLCMNPSQSAIDPACTIWIINPDLWTSIDRQSLNLWRIRWNEEVRWNLDHYFLHHS